MKLKLIVGGMLAASMALAQNPLSTETKAVYEGIRNNIVRAAEKMPEENYSFKPTPDVRSYGQLIGHVADAQYLFCAPVSGEKNPQPNVEKSMTSKADLVKALKDGFAFCDAAYAKLTDASASEMIKFFGRDRSKLGTLYFNSAHNNEHYGNIVTYLRLKGIVPPSSEPKKAN